MTQEELETLMDDSELELLSDTDDSVTSADEEAMEVSSIEEPEMNSEESSFLEEPEMNSEEDHESSELDDESILEMIDDEGAIELDTEEIDLDQVSDAVMAPPADDEHRVVEQLDDVTRESEEKASEVFDKLDEMASISSQIATYSEEQVALIQKNIEIFEKLSLKFSDIETFTTALEENKMLLKQTEEAIEAFQKIDGIIAETMNIMQYQDIHRQKIERVVNVMRALSHYMQSLFNSSMDDSKRSTSAVTIDSGDGVNEEELEALIASFSKK